MVCMWVHQKVDEGKSRQDHRKCTFGICSIKQFYLTSTRGYLFKSGKRYGRLTYPADKKWSILNCSSHKEEEEEKKTIRSADTTDTKVRQTHDRGALNVPTGSEGG